MNFGKALEFIEKDNWNKVTRRGWNGKDMWIHKVTPPTSPFSEDKSKYEQSPYLEMKTSDGRFVP